jgi:hypothetical protein
MKSELDKVSVVQMARGAILERVDYEMAKVLDNIIDPNTKATGKRKITVTLDLVPDDERRVINLSASAKSTLCVTNPIATSLFITSKPGTGEMAVVEMGPQIPGQLDYDGGEQENPKLLRLPQVSNQ